MHNLTVQKYKVYRFLSFETQFATQESCATTYILFVWPLFSSAQTQINLILAMPQAVKMGVNWPGGNQKLTV